MKTSLIIHGHFYQPPRENPFTGIVPNQGTAKPWANWNEAVYRTCYAPNASSRYLAPNGKVLGISNNYNSISFNFGPTLLQWLESAHPELISKLKQADIISIKNTGHSNAMAQGYNHSILPLDSLENMKLQIKWAINDYEEHFGHKPEGFWCPECAINKIVIDQLIDNNISFVVLSPWQAATPDGSPAPCDRAFFIEGESKRTLSAFFYDPEMASGISFGHMLRNADTLYRHLVSKRKAMNNPKLIHWATDGEIYGHHEPYGDMALAALIRKVEENDEFELTNYASYLEKNPPKETMELREGTDGLGSSWSCEHGVRRWYDNCGCHTGGDDGWDQKWRTPLRKAFSNLSTKAHEIFYQQISSLLGPSVNPVSVLESYGTVATNWEDAKTFVSSFNLSEENSAKLATLLDAMRNVLFSFTSCGWFFNDISGIEPKQNIMYAVYAAKALSSFTKSNLLKELLSYLKEAKSNLQNEGNGESIALQAEPKTPSYVLACGFFMMNYRLARPEDKKDSWGFFQCNQINEQSMEIENVRTLEKYSLTYTAGFNSSNVFVLSVKNLETGKECQYTSRQITLLSLQIFTDWVENCLNKGLNADFIRSTATNINNYMMLLSTNKSLARDNLFNENIGLCLKSIKSLFLPSIDMQWNEKLLCIKQLTEFVTIHGRKIDKEILNQIFSRQLKTMALRKPLNEEIANQALSLLSVVRFFGIQPDITHLQNAFYPFFLSSKENPFSTELLLKLKESLNFSSNLEDFWHAAE